MYRICFDDIANNCSYFIPILHQLIMGCTVSQKPTAVQIQEWTSLFVNMYGYFQEYDWVSTWGHPVVVAFWRKMWCDMYEDPSTCAFVKVYIAVTNLHGLMIGVQKRYLEAEKPTLRDLDSLLSLFAHFLFPITVPLPPHPSYHATHHGLQTILGVIANSIYGSSLIIWDHGMLWREKIKV